MRIYLLLLFVLGILLLVCLCVFRSVSFLIWPFSSWSFYVLFTLEIIGLLLLRTSDKNRACSHSTHKHKHTNATAHGSPIYQLHVMCVCSRSFLLFFNFFDLNLNHGGGHYNMVSNLYTLCYFGLIDFAWLKRFIYTSRFWSLCTRSTINWIIQFSTHSIVVERWDDGDLLGDVDSRTN